MLHLSRSTVRPLALADTPSLARHANNRRIWRNLRDLFPHPYTEQHAVDFITQTNAAPQPTNFAIEVDATAVGVIGFRPRTDVERLTAELGYWLSEDYWGRGILTEVVAAFTPWAMNQFNLTRIDAWVFHWNPASARVLEKAGYTREALLRRSAVKDGEIIDRWLFSYTT